MLKLLNPNALWFLSTLAVPIALHLLNRRRTRQLIFPSVRFLKNSRQPQEGRRNLRNLLLLALRLLTLTLAVFWLAQPQWIPPKTAAEAAPVYNSVILVDCSASMATGHRFQRAREALTDILKKNDFKNVALLASSDSIIKRVPFTQNTDDILSAFDTLQPTYLPGNHLAALKQAAAWLQTSGDCLHIISDFQNTDWAIRQEAIPKNVPIRLHPVSLDSEAGNCAVTDVRCQRLGARRLRVLVTVTNFSAQEQQRQLEVTVDTVARKDDLTLAPYQSLKRAFLFDDVELSCRCTAALSPDAYQLDDTRLFWGDGTPPLSVLLLTDDDSPAAAVYTEVALTTNPNADEASEQRFTVTATPVALFDSTALKSNQILFISGSTQQLQTTDTPKIKDFITHGGIVFVAASKVPSTDIKILSECGINVGQFMGLHGMADNSADSGFGDIAPESPLSPLFADTDSCDLFTVNLKRYARLRPDHSAIIHLKTLQNDPLLCEFQLGTGRLFYMAFNFDDWWSDFQLSYSFLPLLHELLLTSAPADYGRQRITCGSTILNELDLPVDTSKPTIVSIGKEICEINVDSAESSEDIVNELDMHDLLVSHADVEIKPPSDNTSDIMHLRPLLSWLFLAFLLLEIVLAAYSVQRQQQ